MAQGIIIKPDNTFEKKDLTEYKDYNKAVGGWIEHVALRSEGGVDFSMYVNETYLISNQFDPVSDFNIVGTALAGVSGRPDLLRQGILGPVVVVGHADNEGENLDLPEQVAHLVGVFCRQANGSRR